MLCPACVQMVKKLDHQLHEFLLEDEYESDIIDKTEHHRDLRSYIQAITEAKCFICTLMARDVLPPNNPGLDQSTQNGTVFYANIFRKTSDINVYLRSANGPESEHCQITLSPIENDSVYSTELIPSHTGNDLVMVRIRSWMQQCKTSHQNCKLLFENTKEPPNRLLDIQPDDLSDGYFRLVENVDTRFGHVEYASISHRWGNWKATPWMLNGSTRDTLLEGQPMSVLPGSYKDAMTVARKIGIKYFWVDSLCIAQDSTLDILREAHRMANVYTNAIINLAGLEARQDGFFTTRDPGKVSPCSIVINAMDYDLKNSYTIWDTNYMSAVYSAPISNRGWILQEQVLAKRTLHFGKDQVFWTCLEKELCETYPTVEPPYKSLQEDARSMVGARKLCMLGMNPTIEMPDESEADEYPTMVVFDNLDSYRRMNKQWWKLIEHYTPRQLTDPRDRLLAIAGLAEAYGKAMNDRLIEGHWIQNLPECLLWRTIEPLPPNSSETDSKPIAPSWSWASKYTAIVGPPFHPATRVLAQAQSIDTQTTAVFDDELTIINATNLQIYAACLPAAISITDGQYQVSFIVTNSLETSVKWPLDLSEQNEDSADVTVRLHLDTTIKQEPNIEYTAAFVTCYAGGLAANSGKTTVSGLLLRQHEEQTHALVRYERVGRFDLDINDVAQSVDVNPLVSLLSQWGFLVQDATYTADGALDVSQIDFESADFMQVFEIN